MVYLSVCTLRADTAISFIGWSAVARFIYHSVSMYIYLLRDC